MYSREVKIINENGLHARPASEFVKEAAKYKSDINIEFNEKTINGKSIIGVLSAGIRHNNEILLVAEGEDEREAIDELVDLINRNFENKELD